MIKDFSDMLKMAGDMQAKMEEAQQKLADMSVEGKAGGDMVVVTLSGQGHAKSVRIDPSLLTEDDRDLVEDLIAAAFNDAKVRLDQTMAEEMGKVTGGLNLNNLGDLFSGGAS